MMQALVVREPDVLDITELPVPEPGPNEVLARVRSVSICGTDAHLIRGDYPGFWPPAFPFTPGHEWAGEIVALDFLRAGKRRRLLVPVDAVLPPEESPRR